MVAVLGQDRIGSFKQPVDGQPDWLNLSQVARECRSFATGGDACGGRVASAATQRGRRDGTRQREGGPDAGPT